MRIRDLIVEDVDVLSLPASATALDATREMVGTHRGSVLVTDEHGQPTGIFTERDLMVRVVAKGRTPSDVLLSEVMTEDLYTSGPDDKVTNVRRAMRERHIRHLPVVESGRVIAVLSMRDLLKADFNQTRHDALAMREYIRGEG